MFYDETKRLEHHDALENSFNVDKGKVDISFRVRDVSLELSPAKTTLRFLMSSLESIDLQT